MKIDDTDKKILSVLQQDAALSLEAIGEAVHLSRNACWRRIKSLEDAGYIEKRVTLLNAARLGLGLTVFLMIRAKEHSTAWSQQFRAATRAMPQVLGVYRMTGDLDYLVRARISDMADYDALYQTLIARVELSDVSATFVMEEIKDTHCLPLF